MLSTNDIDILDTYFKSLQTIPDDLVIIAQKIDKLNIINHANNNLIELMQSETGDNDWII